MSQKPCATLDGMTLLVQTLNPIGMTAPAPQRFEDCTLVRSRQPHRLDVEEHRLVGFTSRWGSFAVEVDACDVIADPSLAEGKYMVLADEHGSLATTIRSVDYALET